MKSYKESITFVQYGYKNKYMHCSSIISSGTAVRMAFELSPVDKRKCEMMQA